MVQIRRRAASAGTFAKRGRVMPRWRRSRISCRRTRSALLCCRAGGECCPWRVPNKSVTTSCCAHWRASAWMAAAVSAGDDLLYTTRNTWCELRCGWSVVHSLRVIWVEHTLTSLLPLLPLEQCLLTFPPSLSLRCIGTTSPHGYSATRRCLLSTSSTTPGAIHRGIAFTFSSPPFA
jgi:hypothetical protein